MIKTNLKIDIKFPDSMPVTKNNFLHDRIKNYYLLSKRFIIADRREQSFTSSSYDYRTIILGEYIIDETIRLNNELEDITNDINEVICEWGYYKILPYGTDTQNIKEQDKAIINIIIHSGDIETTDFITIVNYSALKDGASYFNEASSFSERLEP